MTWLVETGIASIIDAMTLSEVINLTKEWSIMQAACNNLGARMAQDSFVSIGWYDDMAGFWGNRYLSEEQEKGNRIPGDHGEERFCFVHFLLSFPSLDTSFNRYIVI